MMESCNSKSVFVTVGTTKFDSLVDTILDDPCISQCLIRQGYRQIVMQRGSSGRRPTEGPLHGGMHLTSYTYKPSLSEDMARADLVISHAGAGCCMEALSAGKRLITVVNDTLMGNHQSELANQLAESGFSLCCSPKNLSETLLQMEQVQLLEFKPGNPSLFADYMDSVFKLNYNDDV